MRAALDLERPCAGVDRARGACDASRVCHSAAVQFLIHANIELRLAGAAVLERGTDRTHRVGGIGGAPDRGLAGGIARIDNDGNLPNGTGIGIGIEIPGADAIRPSVADDLRRADANAVCRPDASSNGRTGITIEIPAVEDRRSSHRASPGATS